VLGEVQDNLMSADGDLIEPTSRKGTQIDPDRQSEHARSLARRPLVAVRRDAQLAA
jgi:hypothetical protein